MEFSRIDTLLISQVLEKVKTRFALKETLLQEL